jgi:hypothetical protein
MRLIMEVPALNERCMSNEGHYDPDNGLPSGRIKTLDEFLDLPHLNVLLRYILTHARGNNL